MRYHISIRQNLNIYKRLGNFKVSNNRCWINSLLVLLTFLYLEGHAFIFSCIILLEERLGYTRVFFRLIPNIRRGITDNLCYLELAYNLADGTAGVDIYGIHLCLKRTLRYSYCFSPEKIFSTNSGLIDNITFIYFS